MEERSEDIALANLNANGLENEEKAERKTEKE